MSTGHVWLPSISGEKDPLISLMSEYSSRFMPSFRLSNDWLQKDAGWQAWIWLWGACQADPTPFASSLLHTCWRNPAHTEVSLSLSSTCHTYYWWVPHVQITMQQVAQIWWDPRACGAVSHTSRWFLQAPWSKSLVHRHSQLTHKHTATHMQLGHTWFPHKHT